MKFSVWIVMLAAVAALSGCSTPAERARKLYESGEYEQVLARYPNEPIAAEARARFAEQILQQGDYERVVDEFPDTPSAPLARERIAVRLLEEENYAEIIEKYSDTPSALIAREAVAQRMFDDGKLDELVETYPNSKVGLEARERMATLAFEAAMSLSGQQPKIQALEKILTDPRFAGTSGHELAQRTLASLQGSTRSQ